MLSTANRLLDRANAPKTLLMLGVFTRVVTWWFLRPANNDSHFEVIQLLVSSGRLPLMTETPQAYHPPLYYLLAAPFLRIFGTQKAVQVLSLCFSIASLVIVYILIYRSSLVRGTLPRLYGFAMVCFLPQLVMFSLYVSNDTLAIFLGALIVWQSRRFIEAAAWKESFLLAVLTGLGLLTKASFLAFIPILFGLVFLIYSQRGSLAKASWAASVFLAVVLSVGSYKLIDNFLRFHDPFVSSLDLPADWITKQKLDYGGLRSYFDLNIFRLISSPSIVSGKDKPPGFPVLAYATFFYQYIPESNFTGNRHTPFKYLGSLIYAVGLVPTAVFWLGMASLCRKFACFVKTFDAHNPKKCDTLCAYVSVFLLLSNWALMLSALLKYHVWTIIQARLWFPTITGAIVAFGAGIESIHHKVIATSVLKISMASLIVLFGLYLSSEVAYLFLVGYIPTLKGILMSL